MSKEASITIMGCIIALALMTGGCAVHQLPLQHAIYIDHDGSPVEAGKEEFVAEPDFEDHLKKIGDAIRASNKKKVLVFVHGGLNTLGDEDKLEMLTAINNDPDQPFPILVNWDSSFLTTYWEHLVKIRQGEVKSWAGAFSSPAVLLEDAGRMVIRLPISWWRQAENDFKSITVPTQPYKSDCPDKYMHWLHADAQAVNALTCTLTEEYRKGTPNTVNISLGTADSVKFLSPGGIGRTAHYILTFPFKYATVPVVDGFATPAWDNMVRRTRTMYRRPQEFDIRRAVQKNADDPGKVKEIARQATEFKETGALARLLHALNDMAAGGAGEEKGIGMPIQSQIAPKAAGEFELTVIGHSMGTIVLNEFIRNFDTYPNLKITNIVYMGAACSIRDFERSVIPYMRSERGKDARFYNLTLHPWNEVSETNALGLVPRGSLLEWIDNFLTTPLTHMDRTLGKWENIVKATHIIPDDVRDRIFIKGFPVGDTWEVGPQQHGEFDDYKPNKHQKWKFWEKSYWAPAGK